MTMERMIQYKEKVLQIEEELIGLESRLSALRADLKDDHDLSDTERTSVMNLTIMIGLRASVKARLDHPSVQQGLAMLKSIGYESIDDVPVEMLPSIFMGAMERFAEFDHKQTELDNVEP